MSKLFPLESDSRVDQDLVGWFAQHQGAWCGTATELLAAVKTKVDISSDWWPRSPLALYAHIESHGQVFRSLGVAVLLPNGSPRMISLQSCQGNEEPRPRPTASARGGDQTFSKYLAVQSDTETDKGEDVWDNTKAMLDILRKYGNPDE